MAELVMASKVIADMQKMIDKYGDKPFLLEFDLKNEKGEVKLAKICSIGIGRFDTNDEQFYYISNTDQDIKGNTFKNTDTGEITVFNL